MTRASLALLTAFILRPAPEAQAASTAPLAASFVSSKEWKMRRSPVKEEEFTGEVRYWTYSRFVRADWALYRHDDETWEARGNIRGEHTLPRGRGVFEVFGERAVFDQKRRKGSLTGKRGYVDVVLTSADGFKDFGRAGRLAWELDRSASLLDGVRLWGERVDAWADRADYDWEKAALTLSGGRPVLHKKFGDWTAAVKADTVTALDAAAQSRHLRAQGRVRGWIEFRKYAGADLEP
ncbi:MAG: hypothetical protein HY748_10055 [Elusimicrobia bacterium]|nr:hypothetical protein [Elusimicrobiota bacterium]